jgi:hypothetical protein
MYFRLVYDFSDHQPTLIPLDLDVLIISGNFLKDKLQNKSHSIFIQHSSIHHFQIENKEISV